ncbi:hypothetical protein [Burkholderia sp. PU8-34]
MPTIEIVVVVPSAAALIEKLDAVSCDVLVLDYVMPSGEHGTHLFHGADSCFIQIDDHP